MAKTLFSDMVQGSIKSTGRGGGKPFTAKIRVSLDIDEQSDALQQMDPAVPAFLDSAGTKKLTLEGTWDAQKIIFYPYVEGPNRATALPEPDCEATGEISGVSLTKNEGRCQVDFALTLADPPTPEESDGTSVELDLLARKNLPKHIRNEAVE